MLGLLVVAPAFAAGPVWDLRTTAADRIVPGSPSSIMIGFGNSGDAATDGTGVLDVTLPTGLTGVSVQGSFGAGPPFTMTCQDPAGLSVLHCDPITLFGPLGPGQNAFEELTFAFDVSPAASGPLDIGVVISGGGAPTVSRTLSVNASATTEFGFKPGSFDGGVFDENGDSFTQAGGHPYSASTTFEFKTVASPVGTPLVDGGGARDVEVELPPGLIGNPTAFEQCPSFDYIKEDEFGNGGLKCPADSQIGVVDVKLPTGIFDSPVYNMKPLPGTPATFGINPGVPVLLTAEVRPDDYGINVLAPNTTQAANILGADFTFWGVPGDSSHDVEREGPGCRGEAGCALAQDPKQAFITNPTNCTSPGEGIETRITATAWDPTAAPDHASFISHDPPGAPLPPQQWGPVQGTTGCELVPYDPQIGVEQSTDSASSPTGLTFELRLPTDGLFNPEGITEGSAKRVTVTLPEGVTLNPSAGEGLTSCTPADLAREQLDSAPGTGCPNGSRLGGVVVDSPLLEEDLLGDIYIATPDDQATSAPGAENPFDTLLSLYMVIKNQQRGIILKLPGKVEPDPVSGQLVTTFDDLPQLPFSSFKLKFREGGRAPLVSPQACGSYTTSADFVPWSVADTDNPTPDEIVHAKSTFQVTRGVGGGPCPAGGLPPFNPHLNAGTINNSAGTFSPFNLRLTRNDGEQEFTNFSIKLPPGVTGKLAGVPFCPDSVIEAAKLKTGAAELAAPSCPAASLVGRTLVGSGVGSVQTYVPGKVYLAGPYNGSALSIAAITSAKVGPFDIGTVVIREALKIDNETAEVFIDATGSDPIPHIIDGIPVHARDIRVYVDRPDFTLNPTSCDRTSTASTLLGSGRDFTSTADDNPLTITSPFQAANCASLPFKPKLALSLLGQKKRAGNPKFRAVLRMKPGEANVAGARVTLPKSMFIDNAHIDDVCTRVQYAADSCPPGSIYGFARAETPLLDTPLEGPVYLRSNPDQNLPDIVAALHSDKIEIDLEGHIDSAKGGGVRNTFEVVPDAPVSKFVLEMQGGKKGLLKNSLDLCKHKLRGNAQFDGQNGKIRDFKPVVKSNCKGKKRKRAAR